MQLSDLSLPHLATPMLIFSLHSAYALCSLPTFSFPSASLPGFGRKYTSSVKFTQSGGFSRPLCCIAKGESKRPQERFRLCDCRAIVSIKSAQFIVRFGCMVRFSVRALPREFSRRANRIFACFVRCPPQFQAAYLGGHSRSAPLAGMRELSAALHCPV